MEKIIDETQVEVKENGTNAQVQPDTEANGDSSTPEGFDKNPKWIAARTTEKKVQSIMEDHGYADLDEMVADVATSKTLREDIGSKDVKKLLGAQDELDKIHAYWEEQKLLKELQQGDDETSDEAIVRLQKQVLDVKKAKDDEINNTKSELEDKQFWATYDKNAISFIDNQEDVGDEGKEILSALLRNESFTKDVDLNKKSDIKKMNDEALKLVKELEDAAIQAYIDGKKKLTKISSSDDTVTTLKEKKVKGLKDAKQQAIELLRKTHGFK